jgi:hypothetical protein
MIHRKADDASPNSVATAAYPSQPVNAQHMAWNAAKPSLMKSCKRDDALDMFATPPPDLPSAPTEAIMKR